MNPAERGKSTLAAATHGPNPHTISLRTRFIYRDELQAKGFSSTTLKAIRDMFFALPESPEEVELKENESFASKEAILAVKKLI